MENPTLSPKTEGSGDRWQSSQTEMVALQPRAPWILNPDGTTEDASLGRPLIDKMLAFRTEQNKALYAANLRCAALEKERDALLSAKNERIADLILANADCTDLICKQLDEIFALRTGIAAESPGNHDYHGPLGAPNDKGQRTPVADATHERFHRAVGDVLAGKIIPAARKQMEDALKRAPPNPETTASTSKPMPDGAVRFVSQDIGIRVPR